MLCFARNIYFNAIRSTVAGTVAYGMCSPKAALIHHQDCSFISVVKVYEHTNRDPGVSKSNRSHVDIFRLLVTDEPVEFEK